MARRAHPAARRLAARAAAMACVVGVALGPALPPAGAMPIDPPRVAVSEPAFMPGSYWNTPKDSRHGVPAKADSSRYVAEIRRALAPRSGHVRLIGTDSRAWGDTFWWPSGSTRMVQVTCPLGTTDECRGFPSAPRPPCTSPPTAVCAWVRLSPRFVPTDDGESHMVVMDRAAGVATWLWRACPPGPYGHGFCRNNRHPRWTAQGMSVHVLASDGLDGCWARNSRSRPAGDGNNMGHRGMPGFYDAVRYEEVAAAMQSPGGTLGHMLNLLIPDTAPGHVFPYVGHEDGGRPPDIPEGAVIRLKDTVPVAGLSPAAAVIARTLQTFGAVIGDTSDPAPGARRATIRMENLMAERSPRRWYDLGIGPNSLAGIPLSPSDFEFIPFGFGGPSDGGICGAGLLQP